MSVGSVLKVIASGIVKGEQAVVQEIEAFPSQAEHVLADLFKWTAKQFGSQAVQAAVGLAEQYVTDILPKAQGLAEGVVAKLVTDIDHTDAFAWVKGELLAHPELGLTLPDAHTLAGLAWSWVLKGVSVAASVVSTAEADAGVST